MVVEREQLLISSAFKLILNNSLGDGVVIKSIAHIYQVILKARVKLMKVLSSVSTDERKNLKKYGIIRGETLLLPIY